MREVVTALVGRRTPVCFLCKWISEDVEATGRLTDGLARPSDTGGHPLFPASSKVAHLLVESDKEFGKFLLDSLRGARIMGVE